MSTPAYVEVIREVVTEDYPVLTVRPHFDDPSRVWLKTSDEDTEECPEECFLTLDLPMTTDMARQLGKALIDCANEIDMQHGLNS